ncbi:piggyBac transposable element-derived protein 3-like [Bactrocera tryoni]|uniref:piggyBac transposable element-derived protein 3-like n=1 Tax=Bactrocera tryoni TaxID=59916 RepID=UPI001A99D2B2|nr:piggyBac transposable element-derived protein 3-like [Bactrocera tryoni]
MFRKGRGLFELKENEVQQILMGDNSEEEDNLLLDGTITEHTDSTRPEPSTSAPVNEAQHQPVFKWNSRTYALNVFRDVEYDFGKVQICQEAENGLLTPFDIFCSAKNFDNLVQYIVSESIRYAHQNGREFTIDPEEMKAFLGMNVVMGYHILPSLRDYWSTEPDMAVQFISNVMPRAPFEDIRRNLHFCNNEAVRDTTSSNYDRAYKVRPIIEHFNVSFQNALNNTVKQSIDEHMIKFKGHNVMKQYIKNKPVKWGFKLWCRCDAATGYLFEFDLYTGKRTSGIEYGLGESIVLQLTKKVEGLG